MARSLQTLLYTLCPAEHRKRVSAMLRDDLCTGLLVASDYLRDQGDESGADRLATMGAWHALLAPLADREALAQPFEKPERFVRRTAEGINCGA